MAVKHICMICGNKGKLASGKQCPLCKLQHNTQRMTSFDDMKDRIGDSPNDYIRTDPLSFKGCDLFEETEIDVLASTLRDANRRIISVSARVAEQRAAFLRISQNLSKYPETRDIAQFIEKAYSKMRSGWVNIERAQEMVSRRLREAGLKEAQTEVVEDVSLFNEMASPDLELKSETWFHGTSTEKSAQAIWNDGIKPDLKKGKSIATPVQGRTYATKNVSYALIYALGGDLAGSNWDGWKDERYGYVFKLKGTQFEDVQPDEDQVGETISKQEFTWMDKFIPSLKKKTYQPKYYPSLWDAMKSGEYTAWIKGGKIVLPLLTDAEKLQIIKSQGNVANLGVMHPYEMWRVDKSKTKEFNRDGSNFFEIAEKVKERPSQTVMEGGPEAEYSKCSTQIDVSEEISEIAKSIQKKIDQSVIHREFPLSEDGSQDPKETKGLESQHHVTVLYGLTKDEDVEVAKGLCAKQEPFEVEFGEIGSFRTNDEFDVLWVKAISPELNALNGMLRKNCAYENSYNDYHPHLTLGYVQKGACKDLEGECELTGKKCMIDKVTWSDRGGGTIPLSFKV